MSSRSGGKGETIHVSKFGAWVRAVGGVIVFLYLPAILRKVFIALGGAWALDSVRQQVTLFLSAGLIGDWLFVMMLAFYLRREGRTLGELGFTHRGTLVGWVVSALVTAFFGAGVILGALGGRAPLLEISAFNIYNSLAAALGPGVCEEIVFRGFVMTELQRARVSRLTQVLASGILFGLAHVGWGTLTGDVNWLAVASAGLNTAMLGALYGVVYLISRRSLWPAIAGHALGNLVIEPWLLLAGLSATIGPR